MTVLTIRIVPPELERPQALELLRSVQGPTQACPGCLECVLGVEDSADEALFFIQRWDPDAALEDHIRSDGFRRLLAALDLSICSPGVRFDRVSRTEGMGLIEQLCA